MLETFPWEKLFLLRQTMCRVVISLQIRKLAEPDNTQTHLCTFSPYLVNAWRYNASQVLECGGGSSAFNAFN